MAVLDGIPSLGEVRLDTDVTPALSALDGDLGPGLFRATGDETGDHENTPPVAIAPAAAFAGVYSPGSERELFEKVIVVPRSQDLGFVLSPVLFDAEVWSTFRNAIKTLTSIEIEGGAGIEVDDPFGIPTVYGPMQAREYAVTVSRDGPPTIENVITFTFPGVAGTTIVFTGSRITMFTPEIDWGDGYRERNAYLTDVLRARSEDEQRIKLRQLPRPGAAFRVVTLNARDSGLLKSLIYGWQDRVYGVPVWPDATPLTAQASIGATTISLSTAGRAFTAGGILMLWANAHTAEALTIDSVGGSSITLESPTTKQWPAGTLCIPLFRGRLAQAQAFSKPATAVTRAQVAFDGEVA